MADGDLRESIGAETGVVHLLHDFDKEAFLFHQYYRERCPTVVDSKYELLGGSSPVCTLAPKTISTSGKSPCMLIYRPWDMELESSGDGAEDVEEPSRDWG